MESTRHITIGVLAGMGPASTAPFLDLLIEQCRTQYGACHDIDFPHMLIYSLPTPFFLHQPIDDEAMVLAICQGLQRLERAEVDFIAMPCNTAHKYFSTISRCIEIPLLHIVEATKRYLPRHAQRAALFATRTTVDTSLYQDALRDAGCLCVLEESWQQDVDRLIHGVKAGEAPEQLAGIMDQLLNEVGEAGVDTILCACTDITPVIPVTPGVTIIDSSSALAEETIRTYRALSTSSPVR